eukprot:jgi/Mesen1/6941/ME000036S06267
MGGREGISEDEVSSEARKAADLLSVETALALVRQRLEEMQADLKHEGVVACSEIQSQASRCRQQILMQARELLPRFPELEGDDVRRSNNQAADAVYDLAVADVAEVSETYRRCRELQSLDRQLQEQLLRLLEAQDSMPSSCAADGLPGPSKAVLDVEKYARERGFLTAAAKRAAKNRVGSGGVSGKETVVKGAVNVRGVSAGGWLVAEKWITPALWEGMPDSDLTDGALVRLHNTSSNGWMSAQAGDGSIVTVEQAQYGAPETFRIWRMGNSQYCLRATDNRFVVADGGGEGAGRAVSATAEEPVEAARFRIERNPADPSLVHLLTHTGLYLQAENTGWTDGPAVWRMSANADMAGEFQLTNGWGPQDASRIMERHWASFVTEDDFATLAANGVNVVRIPVGWWIAHEDAPPAPWVGGGHRHLDNAFLWAGQHGVLVLVDLHAAPGCQNGWDNGGSRDGSCDFTQPGSSHVADTLRVIRWLAQRYGAHKALFGFQLLNEPSIRASTAVVGQFYLDAYEIVRAHAGSAYVCISTFIDGPDWAMTSIVAAMAGRSNVVLDGGHWYSTYTRAGMAAEWYSQFVLRVYLRRLLALEKYFSQLPIFVGEWSLGLQLASPPAGDRDYQSYAATQVSAYGRASGGWFFYTLKLQRPTAAALEAWSFERCVEQRWIDPQHWLDPKHPLPLQPSKFHWWTVSESSPPP